MEGWFGEPCRAFFLPPKLEVTLPSLGQDARKRKRKQVVVSGLGKLRKQGPCWLPFTGMLLLLEDVA